jgi:hypothetical protein
MRQFLDHLLPKITQLFAVLVLQRIQFLLGLGTDILITFRTGEQFGLDYNAFQ